MGNNLNQSLELKVYSLLGFAQKAGKLISGDDSVFAALKQHQAQLVIMAHDLSDNSRDKVEQKIYSAREEEKTKNKPKEIASYTFGYKQELGHAIGKSPRGVLAVTDKNFAQAMARYLNELN